MTSKKQLLSFVGSILIIGCVSIANGQRLYSGEGAYALDFDYSAFVQLPLEVSQEMGAFDFTIECWFRITQSETRYNPIRNPDNTIRQWGSPTGYTALNRPLISRFNDTTYGNGNNNNWNDFDLQVNPEGYLIFFMGGCVDLGFLLVSDQPLTDNTWYHVAVTVEYPPNPTNWKQPERATMYLDSWSDGERISEVQTQLWNPGAIVNIERILMEDRPIHIAKYLNDDINWPGGQYFLGKIDEVRIWRGARTQDEIWEPSTFYYNRTVGTSGKEQWIRSIANGGTSVAADLVASYNFNEGEGDVAKDNGPGKYHGTIEPGPFNQLPPWSISEVYIVSFVYTVAEVPTEIPLFGFDFDSQGFSYFANYTTVELDGTLYQYGEHNGDKKKRNFWDNYEVPPYDDHHPIPEGGQVHLPRLVYVSNPDVNGTRRMWYWIQNGAIISRPSEVRIVVDCCLGCDGVLHSGLVVDDCGVCGGTNSCMGCDGYGGGELDACGVCNGNNDTCGGCDDKGGELDACGECNGNNASCTCKVYKGFHITEMEYLLLQFDIVRAISNTKQALKLIGDILSNFPSGDERLDVGGIAEYVNEIQDTCLNPYFENLSNLKSSIDQSLNLLSR